MFIVIDVDGNGTDILNDLQEIINKENECLPIFSWKTTINDVLWLFLSDEPITKEIIDEYFDECSEYIVEHSELIDEDKNKDVPKINKD